MVTVATLEVLWDVADETVVEINTNPDPLPVITTRKQGTTSVILRVGGIRTTRQVVVR